MTDRERQIIDLLLQNPMLTQEEIANALGITRSSAGVHLMNLSKEGHILGRGYVLAELTEKYVVGIGAANIDLMGRSKNGLMQEDSNPGQIKMSVGGVTHNICSNLARMGIPVKFITAVGDDMYAEKIRKDCVEAGIDTSHFHTLPNLVSSAYLSIHDSSGEMSVAISDMRVLQQLSVEFLKTKNRLLCKASAIVMDTGLPTEILEYVSQTYGAHIPIFVDPVSTTYSEKLLGSLEHYHTIKPNRQELEVLAGIPAQGREEITHAGRLLLDRGVNRVVVSWGRRGSLSVDQNGTVLLAKPTPIEQMANATGAGDSFMSGLIYGHLKGLSPEDTLQYATAASRLTIQSEYTIDPFITEQAVWEAARAGAAEITRI